MKLASNNMYTECFCDPDISKKMVVFYAKLQSIE